MDGVSEESIRERAYLIWQRDGCPHGRDFEHWLRAKFELEAEAVVMQRGPMLAPPARAASTRRRPVEKTAGASPRRATRASGVRARE
ncbi:MAG: DUF2934 domain-containing protein [Candidatus Binatia bacterium]